MSKAHISKRLRERVTKQARSCCGYCLTSQKITGMKMNVDHIIPEAQGGATQEENLWLSCADCNEYKGDRMEATDPQTGEVAPLFDPRRQVWGEHFSWSEASDQIVGQTPTGRATVAALKLNRAYLVEARREWVKVGWHPPKE
jgi:hypothetical protein